MESIATSIYLPPLAAPHERGAIGRELPVVPHELIALAPIGKHLHLAVDRRLFRTLHLPVVEPAGSWRDLADKLAERAVALGVVPDGQAPERLLSEWCQRGRTGTRQAGRYLVSRRVHSGARA